AACAILGFPVAYFLARAPARWLGVWLFLLVTPLMVSSVVRIFGWLVLLGRRGLVNATLEAAGLGGVDLLHNVPAVVIGLTELLLPFMVLPLMAALETIPRSVEEGARRRGAGARRTGRLRALRGRGGNLSLSARAALDRRRGLVRPARRVPVPAVGRLAALVRRVLRERHVRARVLPREPRDRRGRERRGDDDRRARRRRPGPLPRAPARPRRHALPHADRCA